MKGSYEIAAVRPIPGHRGVPAITVGPGTSSSREQPRSGNLTPGPGLVACTVTGPGPGALDPGLPATARVRDAGRRTAPPAAPNRYRAENPYTVSDR